MTKVLTLHPNMLCTQLVILVVLRIILILCNCLRWFCLTLNYCFHLIIVTSAIRRHLLWKCTTNTHLFADIIIKWCVIFILCECFEIRRSALAASAFHGIFNESFPGTFVLIESFAHWRKLKTLTPEQCFLFSLLNVFRDYELWIIKGFGFLASLKSSRLSITGRV